MSVVIRSAPAGARFAPPAHSRLAAIDALVARGRAFEQRTGGRIMSAATNSAPSRERTIETQNGLPDSTPAQGEADRITALEDRVTSLEGRMDRVEETLKLPSIDAPANGSTPAAAAAQPTAALDAHAIYARMAADRRTRAQSATQRRTAFTR